MTQTAVIRNRKTDWSIMIASLESAGVCFAASDLQKYIQKISRCKLPFDGSRPRNIVIGLRDDLLEDDCSKLPGMAKGHDGYAITVLPERIVIGADNGRGAVYAIYDLLERIGCRWFYPTQDPHDPEVVPTLESVCLDTGQWPVASPVQYRICNGSAWFFTTNPDNAVRQLDWAMKCRYNGMGWQCDSNTDVYQQYDAMENNGMLEELRKREMLLHGPAHSFNLFLPNTYFDEHPEWFGMRDGKRVKQVFGGSQFCWSNADARRQFISNVEEWLIKSPRISILCTLGFDGGPACECPECAESTPSDLVIMLMNELIEQLAVSVPQVVVETSGGYNPIHEPPENTRLHPKLRIVWAHWGRYHGSGYDDDSYPWKPNLESWRKAARNHITLCQYYTDNFAEPWVAAPYAVALEGDRRYILQHEIDGWYMLFWPVGYWWNHSLNGYLGGICLYDVSINPFDAIHDYALHYFGPDAGPLLGAYYEQWARVVRLAYRVRDNAEECDREMLAAQRRDWINPAVKAAASNRVFAYRVGKVEKLHRLAEKAAEVPRLREEIRALRDSGKIGKAQEILEKAKVYTDDVIAYMHELADLEQGLIDRKEIPTFIRAKLKEWIDKEEQALKE